MTSRIISKKLVWIVAVGFFLSCGTAFSQNVALKTRLTNIALLSFDLGVEAGLSQKWTAELSSTYNPWTLADNMKWKILKFEPQVRYWPCQKFMGWFISSYIHGGFFNIGNVPLPPFRDTRYEGWFLGGGIGAGYQFILSRHFNLELEIGGGYAYSRYDSYMCPKCGTVLSEDTPNHYWGPTKANITLVYLF